MRACERMLAPGTQGPRAEPPFGQTGLGRLHLSKAIKESKEQCFIREPSVCWVRSCEVPKGQMGKVQRSYFVLCLVEKLRLIILAIQGLR